MTQSYQSVLRDAQRQRLLDAMYRLDGRETTLHPAYTTFSGLAATTPEPVKRMLNLFTNWSIYLP